MTETAEAIYRNGSFVLVKPLNIPVEDGKKVKLIIESDDEQSAQNPIMKLAENFYEGLSDDEIEEIEKIILDRSNFFGGKTP